MQKRPVLEAKETCSAWHSLSDLAVVNSNSIYRTSLLHMSLRAPSSTYKGSYKGTCKVTYKVTYKGTYKRTYEDIPHKPLLHMSLLAQSSTYTGA